MATEARSRGCNCVELSCKPDCGHEARSRRLQQCCRFLVQSCACALLQSRFFVAIRKRRTPCNARHGAVRSMPMSILRVQPGSSSGGLACEEPPGATTIAGSSVWSEAKMTIKSVASTCKETCKGIVASEGVGNLPGVLRCSKTM